MDGSKAFSMNTADLQKVGIGLLVALIGAGITYLADFMKVADFGQWTPFAAAGFAVGANIVRKWIADNSPKTEDK